VLYVLRISTCSIASFFERALFSHLPVLLTDYDSRTAWLGLAICLLAVLWNGQHPYRIGGVSRAAPYLIALASAALIALGAIVVYHDYPLSMDEYAAVFQSKVFASDTSCTATAQAH